MRVSRDMYPYVNFTYAIQFLDIGHYLPLGDLFGTKPVSPAVFEILAFKSIGVKTQDLVLSWSREVIGHVTIQFPRAHFL